MTLSSTLPTILILGGSGKVAKHLTTLLTTDHSHPYHVHSIIRSEAQVPALKSLGATPHVHSLETTYPSSLASLITSIVPLPSAIIWAAGAGGGDPARTKRVDHEGAVVAMDAAAEAGVRRFILISAFDVRDRSKGVPSWYTPEDAQKSEQVWSALGPYMECKLAADRELRTGNGKRALEYTIVRPSALEDGEGTGQVDAGKVRLGRGVARKDVAKVVVECLRNRATVGIALDVAGGDLKIAEAVNKVVEGNEDCFEGYY